MTKLLIRTFYRNKNDPDVYENLSLFREYHYDEAAINAHLNKHLNQGKLHFAVIADNEMIGGEYLKQNDPEQKAAA